MSQSTGRRRSTPWASMLTVVLAGALAVTVVVVVLRAHDEAAPLVATCAATSDTGTYPLNPEQADNAALIGITSVRRGMPARAATVGIATAMQESSLYNLDYGDRDSVGLFQQRPSQGWGTVDEILDPVYSTNTFYDALEQVDGWQDMEVTVAAQTVQRSAFPDAYAQHEDMARAWASGLTGWSPAALRCTLNPVDAPEARDAAVQRFEDRLARDLGLTVTPVDAETEDRAVLLIDATGFGGAAATDADRSAWAVAQWAVAVSSGQDLLEVGVADDAWTRELAQWGSQADRPPTTDPLPTGRVRVVLAVAAP